MHRFMQMFFFDFVIVSSIRFARISSFPALEIHSRAPRLTDVGTSQNTRAKRDEWN